MNNSNLLDIGYTGGSSFKLSPNILQRHLACFGSSGSGKTVACKVLIEELAMLGIPIIAFDPQGDIASLAIPESENFLKDKNFNTKKIKDYIEKVEVVIWTPAIDKGLPICINPLQFNEIDGMTNQEKTRLFSVISKNIVSLIGYKLTNDEGKIASAVLETLFLDTNSTNLKLESFKTLTRLLNNLPDSIAETINGIASKKFIQTLIKKLNLLNVGSRKLVFQNGTPSNINTLLGKDNSNLKTRISIIYLNTLHTAAEKEFFIASIAQDLYRWMLKNPLSKGQEGIQCSLFLDEIAPYIPPVKKPACKESLDLIFRQGRKYGVSCIVSTQSPGDVDYKAIGQFSSFALGALNTKQDISKVKRRLESITPKEVDSIIKKLPALQPGEFLFISPDAFENIMEINIRWLLSKHTVLSENQIPNLISKDLRDFYQKRFIKLDKNKQKNISKIKDNQIAPDTGTKGNQIISNKKSREDELFYMKNKIFERDLVDIVRPFLIGSFFKKEFLENTRFNYLPLIKVDLTFFSKEGFFKKSIKEIKESLYLNYKSQKIVYLEDNIFKTKSIIDKDPHKIVDMDNIGKIEIIDRDNIDFDFRKLGGKPINQKKICTLMERKYNVKVHKSHLVLFPIWECIIASKKGTNKRTIIVDGIMGKEVRIDNIN